VEPCCADHRRAAHDRRPPAGRNIDYSRDALARAGIPATSVMLISKPYMQRRAYATIRKAWPEVDPVGASEDISVIAVVEPWAPPTGSEQW
jgi:uncharacterized SAM-binding protein YcdF (DUF218 family)